MYNEAEDEEEHKGGRQERHFDAPLFSSGFAGLKYASPGKQKGGVIHSLGISLVESAPSLLASWLLANQMITWSIKGNPGTVGFLHLQAGCILSM